MQDRDDFKPKEIENAFIEVFGSASLRLNQSANDKLAADGQSRFFDKHGQQVDNLLGEKSSLFGLKRSNNGELEFSVYPDANAARERRPSIKMLVDYKDQGSISTETRKIFDLTKQNGKEQPEAIISTSLDSKTNTLIINGKDSRGDQTITFRDGKPVALELKQDSSAPGTFRQLQFSFTDKGELKGVTLNGREVSAPLVRPLMVEAAQTLLTVAKENDIKLKNADGSETSTVTERAASGERRVYETDFKTGEKKVSDYSASGLRTHESSTSIDSAGRTRGSTTDYHYSNSEGAPVKSPDEVARAIAIQRDESGRLIKSSQYANAIAVEHKHPAVEENVKYGRSGDKETETHTFANVTDTDKASVFSTIEKTQDLQGTRISSLINKDGVETKQELRFDADGRAVEFTRELNSANGKQNYSYDLTDGKVSSVRLDGKRVQGDEGKILVEQAQESLNAVARQADVCSVSKRAFTAFLSPESSLDTRTAMHQMIEQIARESKNPESGTYPMHFVSNEIGSLNHARIIIEALSSNDLIRDLSSNDPAKTDAALRAMSKLKEAVEQSLSTERIKLISSDILQSRSSWELDRAQMELMKEQNGPQAAAADRLLAYSQAMSPLRSYYENQAPAADVKFALDSNGRVAEVQKDEFSAKLNFKGGNSTPSGVELYDRHGKLLAKAEGEVNFNRVSGELTIRTEQGEAPSLAHTDLTFVPGGRVERSTFGDNGLRTKQEATFYTEAADGSASVQESSSTKYEYLNAQGQAVDNPSMVASAVSLESDQNGKPKSIKQYSSVAEVEARLPFATHDLQHSADGLSVRHSLWQGGEERMRLSLSSDAKTGQRVLSISAPNESQAIVFDASGKATQFDFARGNERYSAVLDASGKVQEISKLRDGQAVFLSPQEKELLVKDANQLLLKAKNENDIVPWVDQLKRNYIERDAGPEQRQRTMALLEDLAKSSSADAGKAGEIVQSLDLLNKANIISDSARASLNTNDHFKMSILAHKAAQALMALDQATGSNPLANEIANALPNSWTGSRADAQQFRHPKIMDVMNDLKSADPEVRKKALELLDRNLAPVIEIAMDRQRAVSLKEALDPYASADKLAASQARLLNEAQSGNKYAERILAWTEATRQLRLAEEKTPRASDLKIDKDIDAQGHERIRQIKRGDYTAKLNYDGANKTPTSIELLFIRDGKQVSETIKPTGLMHINERSGMLSFSQQNGSPEGLARTETKIGSNGVVEIRNYGEGGLRDNMQSHTIGSTEPPLETKYTHVTANGQPTDNPLQTAIVLSETTKQGTLVERNTFAGVTALETNQAVLRETIQHSNQGSIHKEEHVFTSLSDANHPVIVGSSTRSEDSVSKEIKVSTLMTQNGHHIEETATFRGGEAVSYRRQIGETILDYSLQHGRVANVQVTNGEPIGLSGHDARQRELLKREGDFLLGQMQDLYGIDSPANLESLNFTKPGSGQRSDIDGTLVWKDAGAGGAYHSAEVQNGKLFQTVKGKKEEIGSVNDRGDVKLNNGNSFNISESEGAALRGQTRDNVRINLASKQQSAEFTGVLTNGAGDKSWSVVAGNVYDGNKTFLGHINGDGTFNKVNENGASSTVTEFQNGHFEGKENGHLREWDLTAYVADGKMFIPDANGRPQEHEVRFGMLINAKTQEQVGVVTAPKIAADKSLYDGEIRFTGQRDKVPLSDLGKSSFDLRVVNAGGAAVYQDRIQGVSRGPAALGADGQPRPGTGGYFSFAQAEGASLDNGRRVKADLKTYQDHWNIGDRFNGAYKSNLDTKQFSVRAEERSWQLLQERKQAVLSGNYNEDTLNGCDASLAGAQMVKARDDLSYKKQYLDQQSRDDTHFESLPQDSKLISGSVNVPIWKDGKIESTQTYKIEQGKLIDSKGAVVGLISNEPGHQGMLSMKDPSDGKTELRTMAELKGAVWSLKVPGQFGTEEFKWISAYGKEPGATSAHAQIISVSNLKRQGQNELEYANAANRALGNSAKSEAAAKEVSQKDREFEQQIDRMAASGVQNAADLQYLMNGAKEHVTAEAYKPETERKQGLARPELPLDAAAMAQVQGRLRMGNEVFTISGGELRRPGETEPVGKLLPGYKVQFNNGNLVDLNTEAGTLLQWKGRDGSTHNLVGLGAGTMTPGHGFLQGGLVDIDSLKQRASEIETAAHDGNQKYFKDRPYLTSGFGNWLMDDPDKVMKDLANTVSKYSNQIDQSFSLYFGDNKSYSPDRVPPGFEQAKVNSGEGSEKVSAESLKSRAGYVQLLLATMGSTAADLNSLSQQVEQVQHQIADSLETAVVTVGTAGAGAVIGAMAKAGTISRGAAFMLNITAGTGIGGLSSGLSMSQSSHGFGHIGGGMVKGLAMATPGAFGALGRTAGAAAQGTEAAAASVTTANIASRIGLAGGKSLMESSYQTTMFATADWLKTGRTEQFSLQNLAIGTGSMMLAQGVGHSIGHITDKVGAKVGSMIADSEAGQKFLSSTAGKIILGGEKVGEKTVLWAMKEGQLSLVADISNQMGNAYSFGAVGASGQAIETEKARVASNLGFLKADGTPDTDMVSTSSEQFSWANVQSTMQQAGLEAMATAGLMAYGAHKITSAAERYIEMKAKESSGSAAAAAATELPRPGKSTSTVAPALAEATVAAGLATGEKPAKTLSDTKPAARPANNDDPLGTRPLQVRDPLDPQNRFKRFADGRGGSLSDPDIPIRTAAARTSVAEAGLSPEMTIALNKYIDRGPNGIKAVNEILSLDDSARKALKLDEALLKNENLDVIKLRLELAKEQGQSLNSLQDWYKEFGVKTEGDKHSDSLHWLLETIASESAGDQPGHKTIKETAENILELYSEKNPEAVKAINELLRPQVEPAAAESIGANPEKSSSQPAVKPEPSAKELLDAATAKEGDSLHPSTSGAEELRKMYETKLQDGSLTPSEMKRLLELPATDKEMIEAELLRNRMSRADFATMIKLEPELINQLFNNPGKLVHDVLLPSINRNLLEAEQLNQALALPQAQRKIVLDFLEKALNDPTKSLSKESLSRFLQLGHADRVELANALAPNALAGVAGHLSAAQLELALQAPERPASGGGIVSDAATLVRAMQKQLLSPEQVRAFNALEDASRSAISDLLRCDSLNRAGFAKIVELVKTGELSGKQLADLNTAKLKGWLNPESIGEVLNQKPDIRNGLLQIISSELAKNRAGSFSLPEALNQVSRLNELKNAGIITKKTAEHLSENSVHDTVFGELFRDQLRRSPEDRMSPESLQKLVELSRSGELSLDVLEKYRVSIADGTLGSSTMKTMLALKTEMRQAAESFMLLAPAQFAAMAKSGSFAEMLAGISGLKSPARVQFPDMFPEDAKFPYSANTHEPSSSQAKELTEFMSLMSKGDYSGALQLMEQKTVTAQTKTPASVKPELIWLEKRIQLADLNNPNSLSEMQAFMLKAGTAGGTILNANNPGGVEKHIEVADPIIQLPDGKQFRLRAAGQIMENSKWRPSTPSERAMIEQIQNTDAGKAMLGKTAMVVMEEWAHTTQGQSGGISKLTEEFRQSPFFDEMKKNFASGNIKADELDARINEALREIDISAGIKESGLSNQGLQKLFSNQHLRGEREFFYRFLEARERSAAGVDAN